MQFAQREIVADPKNPGLLSMVEWVAAEHRVPQRELKVRSLLQLPRLADPTGTVGWVDALAEVEAIAVDMPHDHEWFPARKLPPTTAGDLKLHEVEELVAAYICTRFHYIGQHREGARYFGLFRDDLALPVALFAVTRGDTASVRIGDKQLATWNVARVFAFHDAPRNSISRGLSLVGRTLAEDESVCLITHVNQNVGFRATSYEASNWVLLASEPFEHYTYVNGKYTTERSLAPLINRLTFESAGSRATESIVISTSTMPLLPKKVYGQVFSSGQTVKRSTYRAVAPRAHSPIVLLDGDDLLWQTQPLFDDARAAAARLIEAQGVDVDAWLGELLRLQLDYIDTLGYSKERFPRACMNAYRHLVDGPPDADFEDSLEWTASQVFSRPAILNEGARELLEQLRTDFRLAYFVQGDVGVQRSRLHASGLTNYFDIITIKQRRDATDVDRFVWRYPARRHVLVGNSAPLDIGPAIEAGIEAVHVPAHTWEHERGEVPDSRDVMVVDNLKEVVTAVA